MNAQDALAAALTMAGCDLGCDTYEQDADMILALPFTSDQRRALAAAFLDAETLAVALGEIELRRDWWERGFFNEAAAAILAALRETP